MTLLHLTDAEYHRLVGLFILGLASGVTCLVALALVVVVDGRRARRLQIKEARGE